MDEANNDIRGIGRAKRLATDLKEKAEIWRDRFCNYYGHNYNIQTSCTLYVLSSKSTRSLSYLNTTLREAFHVYAYT